jgi:hypothetical protein
MPSLSIVNARIWTGDPSKPWADSISIRDGRVESLEVLRPSPRTIDGLGRTISPGLIDAHMHLLMGGLALAELDLAPARSRRDFERMVAHRHARLAPGEWLIARGWSSENWPGSELPTKAWLIAAGDRPTVCWRMDHHAALVNDAVLARCDLRTPIEGGAIQRDPVTGQPTGLMVESAAWRLIKPLIPEPRAAARKAALLAAQSHAHRFGLTTVGSMEYARDLEQVFAPLRDELTLRSRITLLDRPLGHEPIDDAFAKSFPNDDQLAVIGFKTFLDGTLGSRTARMLADYDDDPGNRGMLVELAAAGRLKAWVAEVASGGWSPSMHAIGDEATRLALDAIADVDPAARPRLEHAQHVDRADVPRFAGVFASMQPLHKADDCRYVERRLGRRRLEGTFAFRSLLEAGAQLAFGSDWPIVSCDPLAGMRTAITGLTLDGRVFAPEQNITIEQALRAYTVTAARCLGLAHAGRLVRGAAGDLVMYDLDPIAADWITRPPRCVLTVAGGRVVFEGD